MQAYWPVSQSAGLELCEAYLACYGTVAEHPIRRAGAACITRQGHAVRKYLMQAEMNEGQRRWQMRESEQYLSQVRNYRPAGDTRLSSHKF